ncbi:hypothetical protein NEPAR03_2113 [Nematocida parisii]|nr:hypothetical protein NEPAR03_2113 [Nematocida parisii]
MIRMKKAEIIRIVLLLCLIGCIQCTEQDKEFWSTANTYDEKSIMYFEKLAENTNGNKEVKVLDIAQYSTEFMKKLQNLKPNAYTPHQNIFVTSNAQSRDTVEIGHKRLEKLIRAMLKIRTKTFHFYNLSLNKDPQDEIKYSQEVLYTSLKSLILDEKNEMRLSDLYAARKEYNSRLESIKKELKKKIENKKKETLPAQGSSERVSSKKTQSEKYKYKKMDQIELHPKKHPIFAKTLEEARELILKEQQEKEKVKKMEERAQATLNERLIKYSIKQELKTIQKKTQETPNILFWMPCGQNKSAIQNNSLHLLKKEKFAHLMQKTKDALMDCIFKETHTFNCVQASNYTPISMNTRNELIRLLQRFGVKLMKANSPGNGILKHAEFDLPTQNQMYMCEFSRSLKNIYEWEDAILEINSAVMKLPITNSGDTYSLIEIEDILLNDMIISYKKIRSNISKMADIINSSKWKSYRTYTMISMVEKAKQLEAEINYKLFKWIDFFMFMIEKNIISECANSKSIRNILLKLLEMHNNQRNTSEVSMQPIQPSDEDFDVKSEELSEMHEFECELKKRTDDLNVEFQVKYPNFNASLLTCDENSIPKNVTVNLNDVFKKIFPTVEVLAKLPTSRSQVPEIAAYMKIHRIEYERNFLQTEFVFWECSASAIHLICNILDEYFTSVQYIRLTNCDITNDVQRMISIPIMRKVRRLSIITGMEMKEEYDTIKDALPALEMLQIEKDPQGINSALPAEYKQDTLAIWEAKKQIERCLDKSKADYTNIYENRGVYWDINNSNNITPDLSQNRFEESGGLLPILSSEIYMVVMKLFKEYPNMLSKTDFISLFGLIARLANNRHNIYYENIMKKDQAFYKIDTIRNYLCDLEKLCKKIEKDNYTIIETIDIEAIKKLKSDVLNYIKSDIKYHIIKYSDLDSISENSEINITDGIDCAGHLQIHMDALPENYEKSENKNLYSSLENIQKWLEILKQKRQNVFKLNKYATMMYYKVKKMHIGIKSYITKHKNSHLGVSLNGSTDKRNIIGHNQMHFLLKCHIPRLKEFNRELSSMLTDWQMIEYMEMYTKDVETKNQQKTYEKTPKQKELSPKHNSKSNDLEGHASGVSSTSGQTTDNKNDLLEKNSSAIRIDNFLLEFMFPSENDLCTEFLYSLHHTLMSLVPTHCRNFTVALGIREVCDKENYKVYLQKLTEFYEAKSKKGIIDYLKYVKIIVQAINLEVSYEVVMEDLSKLTRVPYTMLDIPKFYFTGLSNVVDQSSIIPRMVISNSTLRRYLYGRLMAGELETYKNYTENPTLRQMYTRLMALNQVKSPLQIVELDCIEDSYNCPICQSSSLIKENIEISKTHAENLKKVLLKLEKYKPSMNSRSKEEISLHEKIRIAEEYAAFAIDTQNLLASLSTADIEKILNLAMDIYKMPENKLINKFNLEINGEHPFKKNTRQHLSEIKKSRILARKENITKKLLNHINLTEKNRRKLEKLEIDDMWEVAWFLSDILDDNYIESWKNYTPEQLNYIIREAAMLNTRKVLDMPELNRQLPNIECWIGELCDVGSDLAFYAGKKLLNYIKEHSAEYPKTAEEQNQLFTSVFITPLNSVMEDVFKERNEKKLLKLPNDTTEKAKIIMTNLYIDWISNIQSGKYTDEERNTDRCIFDSVKEVYPATIAAVITWMESQVFSPAFRLVDVNKLDILDIKELDDKMNDTKSNIFNMFTDDSYEIAKKLNYPFELLLPRVKKAELMPKIIPSRKAKSNEIFYKIQKLDIIIESRREYSKNQSNELESNINQHSNIDGINNTEFQVNTADIVPMVFQDDSVLLLPIPETEQFVEENTPISPVEHHSDNDVGDHWNNSRDQPMGSSQLDTADVLDTKLPGWDIKLEWKTYIDKLSIDYTIRNYFKILMNPTRTVFYKSNYFAWVFLEEKDILSQFAIVTKDLEEDYAELIKRIVVLIKKIQIEQMVLKHNRCAIEMLYSDFFTLINRNEIKALAKRILNNYEYIKAVDQKIITNLNNVSAALREYNRLVKDKTLKERQLINIYEEKMARTLASVLKEASIDAWNQTKEIAKNQTKKPSTQNEKSSFYSMKNKTYDAYKEHIKRNPPADWVEECSRDVYAILQNVLHGKVAYNGLSARSGLRSSANKKEQKPPKRKLLVIMPCGHLLCYVCATHHQNTQHLGRNRSLNLDDARYEYPLTNHITCILCRQKTKSYEYTTILEDDYDLAVESGQKYTLWNALFRYVGHIPLNIIDKDSTLVMSNVYKKDALDRKLVYIDGRQFSKGCERTNLFTERWEDIMELEKKKNPENISSNPGSSSNNLRIVDYNEANATIDDNGRILAIRDSTGPDTTITNVVGNPLVQDYDYKKEKCNCIKQLTANCECNSSLFQYYDSIIYNTSPVYEFYLYNRMQVGVAREGELYYPWKISTENSQARMAKLLALFDSSLEERQEVPLRINNDLNVSDRFIQEILSEEANHRETTQFLIEIPTYSNIPPVVIKPAKMSKIQNLNCSADTSDHYITPPVVDTERKEIMVPGVIMHIARKNYHINPRNTSENNLDDEEYTYNDISSFCDSDYKEEKEAEEAAYREKQNEVYSELLIEDPSTDELIGPDKEIELYTKLLESKQSKIIADELNSYSSLGVLENSKLYSEYLETLKKIDKIKAIESPSMHDEVKTLINSILIIAVDLLTKGRRINYLVDDPTIFDVNHAIYISNSDNSEKDPNTVYMHNVTMLNIMLKSIKRKNLEILYQPILEISYIELDSEIESALIKEGLELKEYRKEYKKEYKEYINKQKNHELYTEILPALKNDILKSMKTSENSENSIGLFQVENIFQYSDDESIKNNTNLVDNYICRIEKRVESQEDTNVFSIKNEYTKKISNALSRFYNSNRVRVCNKNEACVFYGASSDWILSLFDNLFFYAYDDQTAEISQASISNPEFNIIMQALASTSNPEVNTIMQALASTSDSENRSDFIKRNQSYLFSFFNKLMNEKEKKKETLLEETETELKRMNINVQPLNPDIVLVTEYIKKWRTKFNKHNMYTRIEKLVLLAQLRIFMLTHIQKDIQNFSHNLKVASGLFKNKSAIKKCLKKFNAIFNQLEAGYNYSQKELDDFSYKYKKAIETLTEQSLIFKEFISQKGEELGPYAGIKSLKKLESILRTIKTSINSCLNANRLKMEKNTPKYVINQVRKHLQETQIIRNASIKDLLSQEVEENPITDSSSDNTSS